MKTKKPAATRMTSIRLDPALVALLKQRGQKMGIGWQTVLKLILHRYARSEI